MQPCFVRGERDMIVEAARPEELETLRRLARQSEAHWGYDESFMDVFDRTFNITGDFLLRMPVFVFRDQGKIIAFWGVIPDGNRCGLEYFYIAETALNRGYGRYMWNHLISWCQANGITQVSFVTSWEAVGFYEKMGAKQDGIYQSSIDGRDIPHFVYLIQAFFPAVDNDRRRTDKIQQKKVE